MKYHRDRATKTKEYCTPPEYVELIVEFLGEIDLDPCTNDFSFVPAKRKVILPENGLNIEWDYRRIFINPPYGTDKERKTSIKHWIRKIYDSRQLYRAECLALLPVATNTIFWKNYIFNGANSICFIYEPSVKFYLNGVRLNKGAPMACCFVYWGNRYDRFHRIFSSIGKVVYL